jgi:hypothetical protein
MAFSCEWRQRQNAASGGGCASAVCRSQDKAETGACAFWISARCHLSVLVPAHIVTSGAVHLSIRSYLLANLESQLTTAHGREPTTYC